jgi:hypothetical protein
MSKTNFERDMQIIKDDYEMAISRAHAKYKEAKRIFEYEIKRADVIRYEDEAIEKGILAAEIWDEGKAP